MEKSLPVAHSQFLDRLRQRVSSDPSWLGLAVAGSFISPGLDEHSDLDFVLVAKDEAYETELGRRKQFAGDLGNLVASFTGEHVGEPRLLICLYDNPILHVDLKVMRLESFRKERYDNPAVLWEKDGLLTASIREHLPTALPADPQWIEDRFWTWIHYTATKIRRGERIEGWEAIDFVRGVALAPLAWYLAGQIPRGVRRLETALPHRVALFRSTLPKDDSPQALIEALHQLIHAYRVLRAELPPGSWVPGLAAERAVMTFLERP